MTHMFYLVYKFIDRSFCAVVIQTMMVKSLLHLSVNDGPWQDIHMYKIELFLITVERGESSLIKLKKCVRQLVYKYLLD